MLLFQKSSLHICLLLNDANFNNIGLGQIDLTNGSATEAKSNFNGKRYQKRKDWEEFLRYW
jgi:hypothetical protein